MGEPKAEPAKLVSAKVVQYIGTADVRRITKADWHNVGSKCDTTEWTAANKYTIPVDKFDDAALLYLDEMDSGFVVSDVTV